MKYFMRIMPLICCVAIIPLVISDLTAWQPWSAAVLCFGLYLDNLTR